MTIPTNPGPGREWTNETTGITYVYDGERWLIKTAEDSIFVTDEEFQTDQARQDEEIAKLTGLAVDRRVYVYAGVNGVPNAGQFSSDSNVIAGVTKLSFGVRDQNNELTPIKSIGDQVTLTGESTRTTFLITGLDRIEGVYDVTPVTTRGTFENLETYIAAFGVDTSALSARVLVGEVKQEAIQVIIDTSLETQSEIQEDLETLENKVSALEGSLVDGRWSFESDNRLPSRGEFALRNDGAVSSTWNDATSLLVNEIDFDGKQFTFENISVGDVLRLGAPDTSGAEYRITEVTGIGVFGISYIFGAGAPDDEIVYGFSFLSAFDPAGLATIDYVDAQDARKLNLTGGTMTGGLFISNGRNMTFQKADGTNQFAINPNVNVDYYTNIYAFEGDGVRFRVSPDQSVGDFDTLISIGGETQSIGGREYRGTLALNRVRTPGSDDQAANKWYVDNALSNVDLSAYLPLSGGDMTGDINMQNCRLDTFNADGVQTMEIAPSGFIKTRDMLRVVRQSGPILEGRQEEDAGSTTSKIWSDGTYEFRGPGRLYNEVNIYDNNRLIFRGTGNTNVGYIEATNNNQLTIAGYSGKTINIKNLNAPSANTDAATKIYVDSALAPYVTETDVQNAIDTENVHLRLSGGTLTSSLSIKRGSKDNPQWKISPNDGDNYSTSIYSLSGGQMRFRTSHTESEGGHIGSHIILDPNGGSPETKIYKLVTPTAEDHAANKKYVDDQIAANGGGFTPGDAVAKSTNGSHSIKGSFYETNGTLYYVHH